MSKEVVKSSVVNELQLIKEEINKLKHISESVYKTNGNVEPFENLQNLTSEQDLIKMYSAVRNRKIAYDDAADELNRRTVPVFKFEGSTLDDWKHDVELRLAIIEQKSTLDELTELKKGYEELMDKDDKMALLQSKQAKLLKKLKS